MGLENFVNYVILYKLLKCTDDKIRESIGQQRLKGKCMRDLN